MYAAPSASNAAASIRRAPSRTISSINDPPSTGPAGASSLLVTTVSTGVPFRPALARGPYSIPGLRTRREGTPPDLIHRFRALLASLERQHERNRTRWQLLAPLAHAVVVIAV